MSEQQLTAFVEETAEKFAVPGLAVGVWADGREIHACHGVTSLENPLPVDGHTLFQIASISKSVTATALMRLAEQGRVDLEAPVRSYVPELALADEAATARITVMHLLNHTSGLDWNLVTDTGEGDDALAAFVARLAELPMVSEPGARASYSQGGYNLLGRVIECVTGRTYEQAVTELVLEPVGMSESFFLIGSVITRRFVVGHEPDADGRVAVSRMWKGPRYNNPGGGLLTTVADLLRWSRFHLGDGRTESGERILSPESLRRMQQPTVELKASSLGDAFGICWFLREVGGVRAFGHGGSASGQMAELLIVPERDFAVVSLANATDGMNANQEILRWTLEHHLGLVDRDAEPLPHDPARAAELVGRYDSDAMTVTVDSDDQGMTLAAAIKPELRAALGGEAPADYPPESMGLLPGDGDEYIVTGGGLKGQRGCFTRDADGNVTTIDLAGRVFARV
ncbi:serine hydrolase domain-containing protein [Streptacidiphilus sp. MAP5-3]|uniref:serine hydrolase domain-containing protein n=1 Tax=unclassified Streptacidiphilus TaxID=2643834 RepID=UPI003514493F